MHSNLNHLFKLLLVAAYREYLHKRDIAARSLFGSLSTVFLTEFLNPTCRIHNLLFARIKWMALRTDFNIQGFIHG